MRESRSTGVLRCILIAVGSCFMTACLPPAAPSAPSAARQIDLSQPALEIPASPSASPTEAPLPTVTLQPTPEPPRIAGYAEVGFVLPPVIQHVAEDSASIFFELEESAAGVAWLMSSDQGGQWHVMDLDPTQARHQLLFTDLMADSSYQVFIGLGASKQELQEPLFEGEPWGPVTIQTKNPQGPLRVGVFGDSGFGDPATAALAGWLAGQQLDLVIHTGDLVYRAYENTNPAEAFAAKWFRPLRPLLQTLPIYPVIGNHDIEPAARLGGIPYYYSVFPPFPGADIPPSVVEGPRQWYAFTSSGVRFLMLDTQVFFGDGGRAEQDAWLARQLADSQDIPTILVFHVPPFSSGGIHAEDGYPVREWLTLIEQSNVPLVLSGHSHNYERLEYNGVTYIVSGGGSATLYQAGAILPESRTFSAQTHAVILQIQADRISVEAYGLQGEIFDETVIPLRR